MRIIARRHLNELARRHPRATRPLQHWYLVASAADWSSLDDVRSDLPSTDDVEVASGRRMLVFNIGGGSFRLIVGRNFDLRILYIKRLLTHAEYDKQNWKAQL